MDCASELIAGLLAGMPFDDSDLVMLVDIVPNRLLIKSCVLTRTAIC